MPRAAGFHFQLIVVKNGLVHTPVKCPNKESIIFTLRVNSCLRSHPCTARGIAIAAPQYALQPMSTLIPTTLFEGDGVSVFGIPPGAPKMLLWDTLAQNTIWSGQIRLIEQESLSTGSEFFLTLPKDLSDEAAAAHVPEPESVPEPTRPRDGLRLKLELYNRQKVPPSVGSLTTISKDIVWGQVWYNPVDFSRKKEGLDGFYIANDKEETIEMSDSPKHYRIVVQLPGSAYTPWSDEDPHQHNQQKQMALGLRFDDRTTALVFNEAISVYKRRFRNYQDQYQYEYRVYQFEHLSVAEKVGLDAVLDEGNDEDDFGAFQSW